MWGMKRDRGRIGMGEARSELRGRVINGVA